MVDSHFTGYPVVVESVSSITSPACTSMHCSEHVHWMSTQSTEVAGDVITADLCLGTQMKTGRGIATNVNTISVTNALVPIPGKKTGDKRDTL